MVAVLLITQVLADIPAHCLQSDVLGTWSFQLSAPVNGEDVMLKCDKLDVMPYELDITLSVQSSAVDVRAPPARRLLASS